MQKKSDTEAVRAPDTQESQVKGTKVEMLDLKGEPFTGFEVSIWIANPALVPRYEPVIKRISETVREMTGSVCHECVQVKLRW